MILELDEDRSGELEWEEFCELMRLMRAKDHQARKAKRERWDSLTKGMDPWEKERHLMKEPAPEVVSESEEEEDNVFAQLLQAAQQPHFKLSLISGPVPETDIPRVPVSEDFVQLEAGRPLTGKTGAGSAYVMAHVGEQPVCHVLALHILGFAPEELPSPGPSPDGSPSQDGSPSPDGSPSQAATSRGDTLDADSPSQAATSRETLQQKELHPTSPVPDVDVQFIAAVAEALRKALCYLGRCHAIATVLNQATTWCHRHLAAGCAFGAVKHNSSDDALQLICAMGSRCKEAGRLYLREEHPLLFSGLDKGGVVVYEDVMYDQAGAPGPGRLGGGVTSSGLLLVGVREAGDPTGQVVATLGADLFQTDPLKGQPGTDKRAFTAPIIAVAAEAGQMAGEVVHSLLTEGDCATRDWDTAFYEVLLVQMQGRLRDREASAIARLKRPIMPDFVTIGIVDGIMDLLLWNIEKPPGFPWSLKKAMFLDQSLWTQMTNFHPATWEGSRKQLWHIANTLDKFGVDMVDDTQPLSLILAFAWLDLMVAFRSTIFNKKHGAARPLPFAPPLPQLKQAFRSPVSH